MRRKPRILIAVFLVLAILFSVASCAIGDTDIIYPSNTSVKMPHSVLRFDTISGNNDTNPDTFFESTNKETDLSGNNYSEEPFYLTLKECLDDFSCVTSDWDSNNQKHDVFNLACEAIAYDLYDAGFDVFQAFAIVDDVFVPGIAFTNMVVYEKSGDITVYECGFIQIVETDGESGFEISPEKVQHGVAVVPAGEGYDMSVGFVLTLSVAISSYSAIYNNLFFRYDQIGDYIVGIDICDNNRKIYDETIDLFNFDTGRFVFHGNITYKSITASPYFSNESKAFSTAFDAINKVIEIQNNLAYAVEKEAIIIFSEDVINEYLLNNQQGTINGFLLEKINGIKLEENQFVVVTTEGVAIETVVDTDALAKERLTNGIISAIGNAILVGGSVFFAVATAGTGAPLAITVIGLVASTGAAVYGISNIIEAGQEIYYGANGDIINQSFNPVLEGFKAIIPDNETATKAYHIWGIGSSVAQALIVPAGTALGLVNGARAAGATITKWQATLMVTRAVVVEAVKIGLTAAISAGVGYISNQVVTDLTGSENWGKIAGFTSGVLAGFFTYKSLNKLDARFNFSGLHSKMYLKAQKVDLTKEDVVKQFSEDKWANMTANEKKMMIERIRDYVSEDLHLQDKPGIRYYNNSSKKAGYGYYNEKNNTININEHYFNVGDAPAQEVFDTVCHEIRHCYQAHNLGLDDVSTSYLNYVVYEPQLGNYYEYYYQPCEVDARNYAEFWVNILKGMTQ